MKIDLVHTNNFQVFSSHASQSITPRPENFFVANIDQKLMDCSPATSSVAFSADLALPTLSNISGFTTQKNMPSKLILNDPATSFLCDRKEKICNTKGKREN